VVIGRGWIDTGGRRGWEVEGEVVVVVAGVVVVVVVIVVAVAIV